MTIAEMPRVQFSRVPYTLDATEEGFVAYNDELRVVAFGESQQEAIGSFYESVLALADYCISKRLPIPAALLFE